MTNKLDELDAFDAFDTFGDSSQPTISQSTSKTMRRRKAIYIAKYMSSTASISPPCRYSQYPVLDSISADT
jgi:hypothetical protein